MIFCRIDIGGLKGEVYMEYPGVKRSLAESIKNKLREYCKEMNQSGVTKLPSENILAEQFKVSRVTIRRALDDLEQENIVLRIHGKGTFVNPEAMQVKISLTPTQEFFSMIRRSGYQPHVELIDLVKDQPNSKAAGALSMPADTPMIHIEKLYFADGRAAIICLNTMPQSIFKEYPTLEEWRNDSVFKILWEKAGCHLVRDRTELRTRSMAQLKNISPQAKRLDCESVLEFDIVHFDDENRPMMYGLVFFNTDYIRFSQVRNLDVYD